MACHWVRDEQSHNRPITDLVTFQQINVVCFECRIDLNSVVCFIRSKFIKLCPHVFYSFNGRSLMFIFIQTAAVHACVGLCWKMVSNRKFQSANNGVSSPKEVNCNVSN